MNLKAKTPSEITAWTFEKYSERKDSKWVRLEDAQKEIDKLKQKLQQLIDELGHRPSELGTLYSTYQEGWLDAMGLAIQKFEELLKEEKEAKDAKTS